MTAQLNGSWDAAKFFEELTATNKLAQSEHFVFCRVSGLDGFEEAVNEAQTQTAFVCVSDIADGYTELNNTPRTRRVKTVFFAMRHAAEDMAARAECMETMRELFRQFMSRLLPEKVRLEQNCIYLDPRISFNEIDRYFFSGAAALSESCLSRRSISLRTSSNGIFIPFWASSFMRLSALASLLAVRKILSSA